MASKPGARNQKPAREGWQGWDEYAPFYDWENAQTLGRRDVPFWQRVAGAAKGPVLELGCGTGRVTRPLARAGIDVVGIDRSAPMLARALTKSPTHQLTNSLRLVRGDIRALPFAARSFSMVLAPYGILQSLTRPSDLTATLASPSLAGRGISNTPRSSRLYQSTEPVPSHQSTFTRLGDFPTKT